MLIINITNLVMLIITMVKFIMAKPTMAQLVTIKLIIMVKITKLNQLLLN